MHWVLVPNPECQIVKKWSGLVIISFLLFVKKFIWGWLLCISTSFRVLRALKSWSNYFFQQFSSFFVHFLPFSVISCLKSTKNFWKWTKKVKIDEKRYFWPAFRCPQHPKAGRNTQQPLFFFHKFWNRLKTCFINFRRLSRTAI